MTKRLLRLLRIVPLALLFAGAASAQTTSTIIGVVTDASTGKPVAGALVVATSPGLQGEQTAVTDAGGNYRFTLLPAGEYKLAVQLEGYKPAERSDIRLSIDKTIRANLAVVPEAVQLEEQVVRTGAAPVVNVGSVETGAVVSKEFMTAVPVGRGYEAIAVVAPTARQDLYGISFSGAQSPENQYILDGFNATDPSYGTRGGTGVNPPPALRSDFVQEIDVKTGGFGAEWGRATGGVLNVVLKSGSNEFHGSVFSTFTPDMWIRPDGQAIGSTGEATAIQQTPSKGQYQLDYGFELGGPILKDKLWFYGGFSPIKTVNKYDRFVRADVVPGVNATACPSGYTPTGSLGAGGQCVNANGDYAQNRTATSETDTTERSQYQYVGKLTFLANENHNITVSAWGSPGSYTAFNAGFVAAPGASLGSSRYVTNDQNQNSVIAKYGGKFLDKRLVAEVTGGWYGTDYKPGESGAFATSPAIEWTPNTDQALPITSFEPNIAECQNANYANAAAICPTSAYMTGGRGGLVSRKTDRWGAKASLAYLFDAAGSHNVKGGVDLERLDYQVTNAVTGGTYWRYRSQSAAPAGAGAEGVFQAYRNYGYIINPTINPTTGAKGTDRLQDVVIASTSNTSVTNSFGYFLQDVWQIPMNRFGNLTLNYGIRLETQDMYNKQFPDNPGFTINNEWSPRISAIWDFTGQGRGKLGGNWGRYYWAMPLDMGNRAFGGEIQVTGYFNASACPSSPFTAGSTTTAPGALGAYNTNNVQFDNSCALGTVARGNPGAYRQTGGGTTPADSKMGGAYVDQFGAVAEYEILPDFSIGVDYIGRRQGNVIEDMSSNDGADYFIGNPGKDRNIYYPDGSLAGNSKYVTTVDPQTGRSINTTFPTPVRSYDGVTFRMTKNYSKNWLAQASYTYSYLRGNYPGPFRPETGQLDPGITSEYDLASLMANRYGFLPGDQTHNIKLYGAYNWVFTPRFNVTGSVAYQGLSGVPVGVLGAHPDYGPSEAFIVPRGQGGRSPWTNQVDLGARLQWVIKAPYAVNFSVDFFNVFNSQKAVEIDENYTFDSIAPITNFNCTNKNAAQQANPIAAVQADCSALNYLKTIDGKTVTVNPNWGKAASTTTAYQIPLAMRLGLSLTF